MNRHCRVEIALLGALALMVGCGKSGEPAAAAPAATTDSTGIPAGAPASQRKFSEKIIAWNQEFTRRSQALAGEANPLKKEALQKEFAAKWAEPDDDLYSVIGPTGEFKDWRGRGAIRPLDHGGFELSVKMGSTNPNVFLFTGEPIPGLRWLDTSIAPNSALAQALATLDVNKDVVVSGNFISMADVRAARGRIRGFNDESHESRFAGAGDWNLLNIREPLFMVRFTSIAQAR